MLRKYDHRHLRRRLIAAAAAAALLLSSIRVYLALTTGPSTDVTDPAPARRAIGSRAPAATPTPVPATDVLRPIEPTADPPTFAVAVARALFDWDTTHTAPLSHYTGRLIAVADPGGDEAPGLVADLSEYLPNASTWAELRPYDTRQWIGIDSVSMPHLWPRALAEAGATGLRPGTTAYTIQGVRHRAGMWEGQRVTTAHDVAFTVFLVCQPSYPTCHLLRLSILDQPLQ